MNGTFRISILSLIGLVVLLGVVGLLFSTNNSSQILSLCTLVCVSLLAILHQSTANKLDTIAKESLEQTHAIAEVKKQTDGITKELVKKSEKVAFDAGKEVGAAEAIKQNGPHTKHQVL